MERWSRYVSDSYLLPFLFVALLYLFPVIAHSSEIRNATVRQTGNRVQFEYDLEGTEQEADVEIIVTLEGRSYSQKDLHLEGDFGKIRPGKEKKILWNVLQDFPRGLTGEFTWKIEASSLDHRQAFALLPKEYYGAFAFDRYSVCFKCHDQKMVLEKSLNGALVRITKFRNGEVNLHFVHVNKEKGRNCTVCHRVDEAGKLEYAKEVPFGGSWKLPVKVTLTNAGGSCVVGCHKPKEYNRDKPVRYE